MNWVTLLVEVPWVTAWIRPWYAVRLPGTVVAWLNESGQTVEWV